MTDSDSEPQHYSWGFVAASAAPALMTGLYLAATGSSDLFLPILVAGFIVAGLHAGLLAAPIFLLLETRWRPRLCNILPASFLIGALPATLLASSSSPASALLMTSLICGGLGLSGGLAFWLVVNRPWRRGSCR
jgi:hypothetical protein